MSPDAPKKVGGKIVARPDKGAAVLRKRPALSIVAKAGIGFVVIALVVGGIFSYKLFFPAEPKPIVLEKVVFHKPDASKPDASKHDPSKHDAPKPGDSKSDIPNPNIRKTAAEIFSKVTENSTKLIDTGQNAILARRAKEQEKVDAEAMGVDPPVAAASATPTPQPEESQSVMADSKLAADVRVNSLRIDAGQAASAAFRAFVADASIGGVYQGTPSRALINGAIAREGQVVNNNLGIIFERIDADKKIIYSPIQIDLSPKSFQKSNLQV